MRGPGGSDNGYINEKIGIEAIDRLDCIGGDVINLRSREVTITRLTQSGSPRIAKHSRARWAMMKDVRCAACRQSAHSHKVIGTQKRVMAMVVAHTSAQCAAVPHVGQ